jgi:hypothetical protein
VVFAAFSVDRVFFHVHLLVPVFLPVRTGTHNTSAISPEDTEFNANRNAKMSTQKKTDSETAGGKLVAGALYFATLLIILAFIIQSIASLEVH